MVNIPNITPFVFTLICISIVASVASYVSSGIATPATFKSTSIPPRFVTAEERLLDQSLPLPTSRTPVKREPFF